MTHFPLALPVRRRRRCAQADSIRCVLQRDIGPLMARAATNAFAGRAAAAAASGEYGAVLSPGFWQPNAKAANAVLDACITFLEARASGLPY